jgi:hypothetical protein
MFGECNTPRKLEILTAYVDLKLEAQWAEPVSLTFHSPLKKLNTEPSIGASHQISVHLAMQFQRRRFLEIGQSETRIAYGSHVCKWIGTKLANFIEYLPYMLMNRNLIGSIYGRSSIGIAHFVLICRQTWPP